LSLRECAKEDGVKKEGKGVRFWLVFASLRMSCFLSALDLTAVSTALPSGALLFLFRSRRRNQPPSLDSCRRV
jgi:hypothetical protein